MCSYYLSFSRLANYARILKDVGLNKLYIIILNIFSFIESTEHYNNIKYYTVLYFILLYNY